MYDILYCTQPALYLKISSILKNRFPTILIKDMSDSQHRYRIEVTFPDDKEDAYIQLLIDQDMLDKSHLVRTSIAKETKHTERLNKLIRDKDMARLKAMGLVQPTPSAAELQNQSGTVKSLVSNVVGIVTNIFRKKRR